MTSPWWYIFIILTFSVWSWEKSIIFFFRCFSFHLLETQSFDLTQPRLCWKQPALQGLNLFTHQVLSLLDLPCIQGSNENWCVQCATDASLTDSINSTLGKERSVVTTDKDTGLSSVVIPCWAWRESAILSILRTFSRICSMGGFLSWKKTFLGQRCICSFYFVIMDGLFKLW